MTLNEIGVCTPLLHLLYIDKTKPSRLIFEISALWEERTSFELILLPEFC